MKTKKVLIVDDQESICYLVKTLLENLWPTLKVSTCTESVRAMEKIRSLRPDLVLLDIQMPEISGSDIAQKIKEDMELKNTPIIFLTGMLTHEEATARANTIGGAHFLAKPIISQELIATVEKYIG